MSFSLASYTNVDALRIKIDGKWHPLRDHQKNAIKDWYNKKTVDMLVPPKREDFTGSLVYLDSNGNTFPIKYIVPPSSSSSSKSKTPSSSKLKLKSKTPSKSKTSSKSKPSSSSSSKSVAAQSNIKKVDKKTVYVRDVKELKSASLKDFRVRLENKQWVHLRDYQLSEISEWQKNQNVSYLTEKHGKLFYITTSGDHMPIAIEKTVDVVDNMKDIAKDTQSKVIKVDISKLYGCVLGPDTINLLNNVDRSDVENEIGKNHYLQMECRELDQYILKDIQKRLGLKTSDKKGLFFDIDSKRPLYFLSGQKSLIDVNNTDVLWTEVPFMTDRMFWPFRSLTSMFERGQSLEKRNSILGYIFVFGIDHDYYKKHGKVEFCDHDSSTVPSCMQSTGKIYARTDYSFVNDLTDYEILPPETWKLTQEREYLDMDNDLYESNIEEWKKRNNSLFNKDRPDAYLFNSAAIKASGLHPILTYVITNPFSKK